MVLAVVVALLCGGASVEVASSRPAAVAPIVAEPDVVVVPTAVPLPAAAHRPSATPMAGPTFPTSSPRASDPLPVPPPPTATEQTTSLEPDLVLLGSWTVEYVVGPGNGNGANVTIPLRRLDGQTIKPGASFDFWTAIGEVSRRTGYRPGAIIVGHHIDPDGALAGGICTVSTALFNAAARAGLQITARRSHTGYLAKYPLGLDAAVAKGDHFRQTLAFRNDTTQPILVRTISTTGIGPGRSLRQDAARADGRVQPTGDQPPPEGS